jgi:hypothetical protein
MHDFGAPLRRKYEFSLGFHELNPVDVTLIYHYAKSQNFPTRDLLSKTQVVITMNRVF